METFTTMLIALQFALNVLLVILLLKLEDNHNDDIVEARKEGYEEGEQDGYEQGREQGYSDACEEFEREDRLEQDKLDAELEDKYED